jgi:ElaB/YqjD/DUF883 family membrane-anchored ribosome-binding protein
MERSMNEESMRDHPNESTGTNRVVDEWRNTIEATTRDLIQSFQQASREVSSSIEQEFSQRPWTYITAGVGGGIVLGYLLARRR